MVNDVLSKTDKDKRYVINLRFEEDSVTIFGSKYKTKPTLKSENDMEMLGKTILKLSQMDRFDRIIHVSDHWGGAPADNDSALL